MRRRWRAVLAGILLALPALWLALRVGLLTPLFNLGLGIQLRHAPVKVRVGVLRSDVWSFVEADDIVAVASEGRFKLPLVTVENLRLEYAGLDAWRGRLEWTDALRLARIRGLSVFLLREKGGAWNISALHRGGVSAGLASSPPVMETQLADSAAFLIPSARVELEDSQLIVNDENRGFHASISGLQGSLDTRSLPLLAFSLNGRTEGKERDDLSLAGEWDRRDGSLYGRLDLQSVPLARYLNYFLPVSSIRFEGGEASLSVRLRRRPGNQEWDASGRAELVHGRVRIAGIAEPLTELQGAVGFDPQTLRFRRLSARFLDSRWSATGSIEELHNPRFNVSLRNNAFALQALSEQIHGMAPLAMTGSATVEAELSGPAARPVVRASILAEQLGLFGVGLEDVTATARLEGLGLEVEELRGRLWGGEVHGRADLGLGQNGRINAALDVRGVRLEAARLKGLRPLPLSGTATAVLRAQGLLVRPALDLELTVSGTALGRLALGTFQVRAAWGPDGLSSSFATSDARLVGNVNFSRGREAAFRDTRIALKDMDLAALAHGLAGAGESMVLPQAAVRAGQVLDGRLAGKLDAELSLDGPLAAPAIWLDARLGQGRLFLPPGPFELREPEAGIPVLLSGSLGFERQSLLWGRGGKPLRLQLDRGGRSLKALLLGRYPLKASAQPGRLQVSLEGDLRILDSLTLFKESRGRIRGELFLGGNFDSPQLDGQLRIEDLATRAARILAPLSAGEALLRFDGQRVALERLAFNAGGRFEAAGEADLSEGFAKLRARLTASTDERGLRLENWDEVGSGNLELHPVRLILPGDGRLRVEGKVRLSNALITYAGRQNDSTHEQGNPRRPVALDLRLALGPNVWYEKRQTASLELFDPSRWLDIRQWIESLTDSVRETLLQPAVFFRLRPTDEDIVVQDEGFEPRLTGRLAIDRGRLTFMDNDFEIRSDSQTAVNFEGRRAEVRATAVARLRYVRDDSLSGRPRQKVVNVTIPIRPLHEEELERSNLSGAFLNYSLDTEHISVEPPFENVAGGAQQREAAINLIVFGDPLVDLQETQGQGRLSRVGEAQLNRILSGEAQRQLAKLSKKGFKFLGTRLIDVLRVVPRVKYRSAQADTGVTNDKQASEQAQEAGLSLSDITVEIGKSLGESLYVSLQGIYNFDAQSRRTQYSAAIAAGQEISGGGLRLGVEYQVSPNRTFEFYLNRFVDDNLEPVPYDPKSNYVAAWTLRMRNTIPTENYSSKLAYRRRFDRSLAEP